MALPVFTVAATVLLVLAIAALLVVRAVGPGPFAGRSAASPTRPPAPIAWVAGERRAARWRWAGVVAGLAGAAVVAQTGALGRGLLLAAPVFGLGVLAGALAGEVTRPAPAGELRVAALRVRRSADYLPRLLGATVVVATVVLVAVTTVTTAMGAPDDMGRAGRTLACVRAGWSSSYGPWPGSYYTLPGAVCVLAGLVAAALVLRRVVRRPQAASDATADDALRRRSAERVVAATGVSVLIPLTGVALTAGLALSSLAGDCATSWWATAGPVLTGVAIAAFAAAAWCAACLLLPSRTAG
ncbi:hypothetical protein AB0368_02535 [Actinoplanes sp. NPDC051475]|uniref:hypothetical protein n=1 Tax=Actinoplanes sp. NPDC051475 TaxID=3157225 RepID=UPI00344B90BF